MEQRLLQCCVGIPDTPCRAYLVGSQLVACMAAVRRLRERSSGVAPAIASDTMIYLFFVLRSLPVGSARTRVLMVIRPATILTRTYLVVLFLNR